MQTPKSTIHEPIVGTGAPIQLETADREATDETMDLEKVAAIKSGQRENRVVASLIATLGTILFVTCVTTQLACAEILSKALVQQGHRIQAVAIAKLQH